MVLIKESRNDNRGRLFATGRDTMDMELELLFDGEASWSFIGYGGSERVQKRDRLLCEINDFILNVGEFHGTATELLVELLKRTDLQIRSANSLSRLLNPQKSILKHEYGIKYDCQRTGQERTLHLTRIPDDDNNDILIPTDDIVTIVTE